MPRGPKRDLLAQRDKLGRIVKDTAMTEREAVMVGTAARIRVHGVNPEYATGTYENGVNASTVIGRMRIKGIEQEIQDAKRSHVSLMAANGTLKREQFDALMWWNDRRLEYHSALLLKKEGSSGAGPGNNGEDSDSYADWCRDKVKLWDQIRDVIQEAANETRGQLFAALDYMVVRDEYHAHFEGPLRYAANAIHRRFLQGRR
jgi:hypothetical protein